MNSPPSHPQLNQPADYEGIIMTQKIIDVSEVEALRTYGDLDDMIMRHHLITKVVEMCAKIAEKYEPEEKQSYIDYASKEIRRTLPAMLCANQAIIKDYQQSTEYEAMKADAERYRKMRKITADECGKPESDVDQAIDQARKI